ncbi:hypothetical protein BDN71DRAFT_884091 [Pleurotus eryngii]|uniref:Uncharacterized protein n=1 Tax=Pleurotus eryngii TaxID=5323 RepID=A0A9P6CZR2_PLEER|nr:hypothetical protein BDN71DRAFT_906233 [Pleurotus eryngii]KAF9486760.1 hypothetical protein BDN71DRAFT_884091 [Pleurotus eryngii]
MIRSRVGLAPLIYDVFKRPDGKLPSVEGIMQAQPGTASGSGMVRIRSTIVSKVDRTRFRISSVPILLHAFEHPYPFTQDIVAALRHHNEPCAQDCDNCAPPDVDLDWAYTHYAEFLNLVLKEGRREPGPEADLIWHAHQLTPRNYREYVVDQLNVFLDHLIPGKDLNAHRRRYVVQRFPEVVTVWRQAPQLFNQFTQQ